MGELRRLDDDLLVTAEWSAETDDHGPRRVTLALTDAAAPDARRRGITSGVLRRAEKHVADMTGEYHAVLGTGAYDVMVRRYLEGKLAEMPAGPRTGGDDYYRGLLALHADLVARGHAEPINALAAAMAVPKDTVKTRLRTARRRLP